MAACPEAFASRLGLVPVFLHLVDSLPAMLSVALLRPLARALCGLLQVAPPPLANQGAGRLPVQLTCLATPGGLGHLAEAAKSPVVERPPHFVVERPPGSLPIRVHLPSQHFGHDA